MKAPIIHMPNFCTESAQNYFDQLWDDLDLYASN